MAISSFRHQLQNSQTFPGLTVSSSFDLPQAHARCGISCVAVISRIFPVVLIY